MSSDRPKADVARADDVVVLRHLVRELSEEAAPVCDWNKVERGLFAEIDSVDHGVGLATPSTTHSGQFQPRDAILEDGVGLDDGVGLEDELVLVTARAGDRSSEIPDSLNPGLLEANAGLGVSAGSRTRRAANQQDEANQLDKAGAGLAGLSGRRFAGRWSVAAVAVLAVAAVALLWLGRPLEWSQGRGGEEVAIVKPLDPATLPTASDMPAGTLDAAALRAGDVVEAAMGPLSFGRFGVLSWTLSAGGRLAVLSSLQSGALVIELESGSISANVGRERGLVVRAGLTEVQAGADAALTVTRSSQGLSVRLERGVAHVGRRGEVARHTLTGPVRASVSLDGGTEIQVESAETSASSNLTAPERALGPSEQAAEIGDAMAEQPTAAKGPSRGADDASNAGQPKAGQPVDTKAPVAFSNEAHVRQTVLSCLRQVRQDAASSTASAGADGVQVSLRSALRVELREDGTVKGASFNPPLLPQLQGCAVPVFQHRFTPGSAAFVVGIELR